MKRILVVGLVVVSTLAGCGRAGHAAAPPVPARPAKSSSPWETWWTEGARDVFAQLSTDTQALVKDAALAGPLRNRRIGADCGRISKDANAAANLSVPEDRVAGSDWAQTAAGIRSVSESCLTLLKVTAGVEADSVLNSARANLVGLSLTEARLRQLGAP